MADDNDYEYITIIGESSEIILEYDPETGETGGWIQFHD